MRVAVAYEPGKPVVIEDVAVPDVGPRDVLVRLAASGICHTDLNVLAGRSALPFPIVPGHEGCGTVERVGSEVRRVRVGDRVLASVSPACGSCWWCLNSMSNHCEKGSVVRTTPRYALADGRSAVALCGCGTFGEAMVVDEASVVAVETDLPDEELALLGCGVTTGLGAVLNTAGVLPGSSVAVIGCGGVGQSVIQGARISGASTIVAIDPAAGRREASLGLGATHTVDPAAADPIEQVMALTRGRGADYSFEVVGQPELIVQAFNMARPEGTVVLVGMPAARRDPHAAGARRGVLGQAADGLGGRRIPDPARLPPFHPARGIRKVGSRVPGVEAHRARRDQRRARHAHACGGCPHGGRVAPVPVVDARKGVRDGRAHAAPARAGAHLLR